MKKPIFTAFQRYLATALAIGAFLLLLSTISLGDVRPTAVNSGTDCRLAADPDACYRQKNDLHWSPYSPNFTSMLPPLSTEAFGLQGPFSAELKYDNDLKWVLGVKYLHMFSDNVGIATKFAGGQNELRANITGGYAFTKDQQIKITYEFLTQNLPFSFVSGTVDEWVRQHSLGVAYQYIIRHAIVHSLEISGYATRAQSKDLENVTFNQQTIPDIAGGGYLYDVNYRRIAGGRENTVLASVNLFPCASDTTAVTLGAGYSDVRYDTHYEHNQAATRPAYKAEVTHLFSPKDKLVAGTIGSAASAEHTVGYSRILPKKFESSLIGKYTEGNGTLPDNKSVVLSVTYPAPDKYTLTNFSEKEELKNWVDKPIIYAARVLAIKDEKVERFEFKAANPLPDQIKRFHQLLDEVKTSFAFSFTDPNIDVIYSAKTIKLASFDSVDPSAKKTSKQAADTKIGSSTAEKEKGSVKATAQPIPDKDYTPDLDLVFVPEGRNQAIFKSGHASGIPETDFDGSSTAGLYQITLTAVGVSNGKSFTVTNGFKLTVLPDGALVLWTGVSTLQQDGAANTPYENNLNTLPVNEKLVRSINPDGTNAPSDTYTFAVDKDASDPGWDITDGQTLTHPPFSAGGTQHITLTAVSNTFNIAAIQGNHPGDGNKQDITINVTSDSTPVFKPDLHGEILFDTTGDSIDRLGAITDGVLLNAMIDNVAEPNLCFAFSNTAGTDCTGGGATTEDGNWKILTETGDPNRYRLLRVRTGTSTGTVNAVDIDRDDTVPSIRVCNTAVSPNQCTTSTATGPQVVKVLVKPDPDLKYRPVPGGTAIPNVILDAATSDGNEGLNPQIQQAENTLNLTTTPEVCVSQPSDPTAACITTVLNDAAAAYTLTTAFPYLSLASPTITFKAPTAAEYVAFADTGPKTNYVRTNSKANGSTTTQDNTFHLRPLVAGKLILVPYRGTVCNSAISQSPACIQQASTSNILRNVGIGINRIASQFGTNTHDTITGLMVYLPPSQNGKSYYLTRYNAFFSSAGFEFGICPGVISPISATVPNAGFNNYPGIPENTNKVSSLAAMVDGPAGSPTSRCNGLTRIPIPGTPPNVVNAPGAGIQITPSANNTYTFYILAAGLNNGFAEYAGSVSASNPLGIPAGTNNPTAGENPPSLVITYTGSGSTSIPNRPNYGRAAHFGQDYGSGPGTGYTDFPAVELRSP